MRFMLLHKGDPTPPPDGAVPDEQAMAAMQEGMAAMNRFDQELEKAGVLLASEGLHPSPQGVRVTFARGGRRSVVDGPFTEAKELVAGFYIIEVKSREEAVEWAKRCPVEAFLGEGEEGVIEIREIADLPDDLPGQVETVQQSLQS